MKAVKLMRFLGALCLLIGAGSADLQAQTQVTELTDGGIYRLQSVGYPTHYLQDRGGSYTPNAVSDNPDIAEQYWEAKAADGGFYLINLMSGRYLKGQTSQYQTWPAVTEPDNNCIFTITVRSDNSVGIRAKTTSNNGHFLHLQSGDTPVCWSDADGTRWKIWSYDTTSDFIVNLKADAEASRAIVNGASELNTILGEIFADNVCSTLSPTYAAMTLDQIKATTQYQSLPAVLQAMVDKVKTGDWSETYSDGTAWDSKHAKRFRLQDYEPYSESDNGSWYYGVQAQSQMNNPTGIYSTSGDFIYVMVENAPKDSGATLYLASVTGTNHITGQREGTELHEGLNIIRNIDNDAAFYVSYIVNTLQKASGSTPRAKLRKLSEYDNIQIHIEGGQVNGYYDPYPDELSEGDTWEDWKYYRDRAKHTMFDLKGTRAIFHAHLEDTTKEGNSSPSPCLKSIYSDSQTIHPDSTLHFWDKLIEIEHMLMGWESDERLTLENNWTPVGNCFDPLAGDDICDNDVSEYFNCHAMGISYPSANLYMSGASWKTNYNVTTLQAILVGLVQNTGNIWGPAHEVGHTLQAPMNFQGATEQSNNVFSNVAAFYRGDLTSRTDYPSRQQAVFQAGKTFEENGTWGTTRMWFQLWLYYHYCGHNKKFYPRLYELLRQNPISKTMVNGQLQVKNDMLQFAKMCCKAAEEDLTDFFTVWGFFVPLDNYTIGDYTSRQCTLTEADIAEVKAEIASYGYPANREIIFIDDRPGSTRSSWSSDMNKNNCGTMGGLNDFINGTTPTADYVFAVDGNKVSIKGGTGGVGFLITDAEGNIIAFANDTTLTVSNETAMKIALGEVKTVALASDGAEVDATDLWDTDDTAAKLAAMDALIAKYNAILDLVDDSQTLVGAIIPSAVTEVTAQRDALVAAREASADEMKTAYRAAVSVYYTYQADQSAEKFVPVENGKVYHLTNNVSGGALTYGENRVVHNSTANADDPLQQWTFTEVKVGDDIRYLIQNVSSKRYLSSISQSSALHTSAEPADTAGNYYSWAITIDHTGPTVGIYMGTNPSANLGIHRDNSNNIVGWETSNRSSRWKMKKLDVDAAEAWAESLIGDLDAQIARADESERQVGKLRPAAVETLKATRASLAETVAAGAAGAINTACGEAKAVLDDFLANDTVTAERYILFEPDRRYYIRHHALGGALSYGEARIVYNATVADDDATQMWEIQTATVGDATRYLIGNPTNGKYLTSISRSKALNSGDKPAELTESNTWLLGVNYPNATVGLYTGTDATSQDAGIHLDGSQNIVGWSSENDNSRWELVKIDPDSVAALRNELKHLTDSLATTLATVADYGTAKSTVTLTEGMLSSNAPCGADKENKLSYLLDDDPATIFHTTWNSASSDGEDHYILITLGDEEAVSDFSIDYSLRQWAANTSSTAPTNLVIQVSEDGETFTDAATCTGMSTTHAATVNLPTVSLDKPTRYIRLKVTASNGGTSNGHAYFAMASLTLNKYEAYTNITATENPLVTQELVGGCIARIQSNEDGRLNPVQEFETLNAAKEATIAEIDKLAYATDPEIRAKVDALAQLAELIAEVNTTVEGVSELAPDPEAEQPLALEGSQFFSNAPQQAGIAQYNNLVDGDDNTIFHSSWNNGNSVDDLDHYLGLSLSEDVDCGFSISYKTRAASGTTLAEAPTDITVQVSADSIAWTDVQRISEGLPTDRNVLYQTPVLQNAEPFRYVRMMVHNTTRAATYEGHHYFVVSAFGFSEYGWTAVLDTEHAYMQQPLLDDAADALNASRAMAAQNPDELTSEEVLAQIAALTAAHDALKADMENTAAKDRLDAENALSELIAQTQEKVDLVSTPGYVQDGAVALTESMLFSNAPSTADAEKNLSSLLDGDASTIFHSAWQTDAPNSDGLDHYILITLSEEDAVSAFDIDYQLRTWSGWTPATAPTSLSIQVSEDGETFTDAYSQSSGLPSASASTVDLPGVMLDTPTRYIRLMVHNSTSAKVNNHAYFAMAALGLNKGHMEPAMTQEYYYVDQPTTYAASTALSEARAFAADLASKSTEEIQAAIAALQPAHDALAAEIDDTPHSTLYADLQALVTEAEGDLNLSGETHAEPTVLDLSGKLYCNARYTASDNSDKFTGYDVLTDGNVATYFHTDYSGSNTDDGLDHYFRADVGDVEQLRLFTVTYTSRNGGGDNSKISSLTVQVGRVEGTDTVYTDMLTVSEGLPTAVGTKYTTPQIAVDSDIDAIRMIVNSNAAGAKQGGHAFCAIAEFGITRENTYAIPSEDYEMVKPEQMLNVYPALVAAKNVLSTPSQVADQPTLQAAYDALQPVHDILKRAMAGEDISTGIGEVGAAPAATVIYDLQGRRISNPRRGQVYIVNGRKLLL